MSTATHSEHVPVFLFDWLTIEVERATWEALTPSERIECANHARRAVVVMIEAKRRGGTS